MCAKRRDLYDMEGDMAVSYIAKDFVIDELIVPPYVKYVGPHAFEGSRFKAVRFAGFVEYVDDGAFADCDMLERVRFSKGVRELFNEVFSGCKNLREVEIPNGIEYIGYGVFFGTALQRIYIPASLNELEAAVFDGMPCLSEICVDEGNDGYMSVNGDLYTKDGKILVRSKSTATSTVIPDGVERIGDDAFYGCEDLVSVTMPATLKKIGHDAFYGCARLETADLPASVEKIEGGAFYDCSSLLRADLPAGLKELGTEAFRGCEKIETVSIPDGMDAVGSGAFWCCSSLREVKIPESLRYIFAETFSGTAVKRLYIPSGTRSIDTSAFFRTSDLCEICVDEGNEYYRTRDGSLYTRDDYFLICARKDAVTFEIPEGTVSIDRGAFDGCLRLESVTIPGSVKTIGRFAFRDCAKLREIKIADGLIDIYTEAFSGTALEKISLPASVDNIEPTAFLGAEHLKEVEIDEGNGHYKFFDGAVYTRDGEALVACAAYGATTFEVAEGAIEVCANSFDGFKNLKEVKLPAGLDFVAEEAFSGTSLERVELPAGLRAVGEGAFFKCEKLKYVKIPASAEYVQFNAFDECPALEELEFEDPYGWSYCDDDDVRHDIDPRIVSDYNLLHDFLFDVFIGLMEKV